MKLFSLPAMIMFICAISLTACVSRQDADTKLVNACVAGIDALNGEEKEISKVLSSSSEPSPVGQDYRHIKMTVLETDHWLEDEVVYECVFEESFGFLKNNYTAAIYQLRLGNGRIVGKSGREIVGSVDEFMMLEDAIRKALYE